MECERFLGKGVNVVCGLLPSDAKHACRLALLRALCRHIRGRDRRWRDPWIGSDHEYANRADPGRLFLDEHPLSPEEPGAVALRALWRLENMARELGRH